ncbi:MAG TPA: kelch repeat-containing protein [Planctomycetota bacterium]|jgi:hypothetical protein
MEQSSCNVFCCVMLGLVLLASSAHAANWATTGSMSTARYSHTATLLPNGKVLVVGGNDGTYHYLASAELYDPATGTWTSTGSLGVACGGHTATLLPSGKVLVAGGYNSITNYLSVAEVYDPATGTWTSTGSLGVARRDHTATLLPSGKVLVAGGYNSSTNYLSVAEVYDPAKGTWAATGVMVTGRHSHTATLLPSGKVLVAGSFGNLSSAEVYDPAVGVWASTGSMSTARYAHTATLLPSGKVLVGGGGNGFTGPLSSAQVYDPATGNWTGSGTMAAGRGYHTATLLASGQVLFAGGIANTSLASAEVYDPATGNWTGSGTMAAARGYHTATLLPNGQVLVAGGDGVGGVLSSAEVFDPAASNWAATSALAAARDYHTATLLPSGKVLVAGGYNGANLSSAEVYDPATSAWTDTGALATARRYHTATLLPSGKVLVAGGYDSTYLSSAEVYDPATGNWTSTGALAAARRFHTATLLSSGKVLVTGGYKSGYLNSAEVYDPAAGTWTTINPMAVARYLHTATLLPSGKVLVAGGANGGGSLSSAEVYDPATGNWTVTAGLMTAARGWHTATLLPNGKVLVAGGSDGATLSSAEVYNAATDTWTATGTMAAAREQHTATLLPSGKVLAAGGTDGTYLSSAEVYDPAKGTWTSMNPMPAARGAHTATLLPRGQVLVVGGYSSSGFLSSAGMYAEDLGYSSSWQPTLAQATSPLSLGSSLIISGGQFKGLSEASGGATNDSATNYPLVQLRSLANDQTAFLLPDPAHPWSNTSFTSKAVTGFPIGPASVKVYVNGIPSDSQMITIVGPAVRLQVGGFPTPTTVGVAHELTVTAMDAGTNTATGYTGTIHFTSSDPQAVLPGDFTFGAFAQGTWIFAVGFKTAGTHSITATDTVTGTLTSSQTGIVVNAAAAQRLTIQTQPSAQANIGQAFAQQPVIRIEDYWGNLLTANNSTVVTAARSSGSGNLLGTLTATASGGVATFTNLACDTAGTITVRFTSSPLNNATSSSIVINKLSQTITFGALANKTYGDAAFTVSATGGASGNPVTFSIASGPATATGTNGSTITITGAGVVTVRASQAGNATYSAAANVDQSFTVAKAAQTITFGALANKTYGNAPFTVSATGGASGHPVTFAIASGPATATGTNGSTITLTGAGVVTVRASQAGNANYNAAANVDQLFTVAKAAQTITFGALANKTYGNAPFTVSATGGASGNPVTFAIASGPATATGTNGSTITITGVDLVTVCASQAGNANYSAAPDVDQSFTVAKGAQAISFGALADKTCGDTPFTVSATGGASGNPATFAIASGPATAAGINGSTITITGVGLVTVRASQAGNANYSAAPDVDQSFTVNPAGASALVVSGFPSPTTSGAAADVTVRAMDLYGNTATGYSGAIHFTSTDAQAELPADYTFLPSDKGVHTFSVRLKTTGTQWIAATDTMTGTLTGTQSDITVNAASGRLVVSGFPSPKIAGDMGSVTVTAKDLLDNLVAGYSGTIHFTSTDGQAELPVDYTFVAGDNGVHTFSVTLKTAGSQSITATDIEPGTLPGSQSSITVDPAAASALVVSGFPSPTIAGDTGDFTVTAQDAYGNTATGYAGTIQFTSTDGQAVLPADYTFVSGDAGVHTFSATFKIAGIQSITATDTQTGTITATQPSITVNPAAASALVVSGFPSPTIAGDPGDFTVTAQDAYGNTATGYAGTIHFTSSDGQAVLPADYSFVSGDGGVQSFSATFKTAGSQSITARDTETGTITGTQSSITVIPAGAITLIVFGFPSPITAGDPGDFSVTAQDAYGNTATGYAGTIQFTSTDGQAVLPGDYSFVPGDAGVYTLSATLKTAGSQSITATDTETGTITGTQSSITVNPVGATTLVVSGFPSPTTAGDAGIVTVTAKDIYGNTATGYTGNIHFTSTDGLADLAADYTFVPADNSVQTFSVTFKTASSQSITATDTETGTISGTQTGIIVNPAAASTLTVSDFPSQTIAGDPCDFTVTAQDIYGNTATGYAGTIHFTSTDGQAVLPTDYSFVSGDGGVQSFSVTLKTAGNQTITARDTETETITGTQSSITVNPSGASTLVLSGFPSPITAGDPGDFSVTAQDAYGNTVTGYAGTIQFTSTDGQAVLPAEYGFVSGDAGVHSFSATLKTAGSQSIIAADTVTETIDGADAGITVNAADAVRLVVSGFPSPAVAGNAGAITVTARDPYENTATRYTGLIQFASTDARAALPLPYQFQPEDNGTQTFSAALATAGTQAITATETVTSTITGTQSNIAVQAGLAHHLAMETEPFPHSQIGQVFTEQPVVRIEDAWDNLVASDSSTVVTAAMGSGPGSLQGTLTAMASGGVATFSDLACDAAGIVTLRFSGDLLLGAISGSIVIDQRSQTIAFGALTKKVFGDAPFTVSATGGASGNPVTFTIASGSATISGSEITLTGAGLVTVRASQAGDANYSAAPDVDQSFDVTQAAQAITFGSLANKTYGDGPLTVSATGGASGNPVTFSIASGPATATGANGSTITLTGAGTVTVQATQAGNATYLPAAPINQSFTVGKATATVTLSNLDQVYTGLAKTLGVATTPAGLGYAVMYAGSTSAPTAVGSYVVVATINSNDYQGGATGTLNITKASASVTLAGLSATYDGQSKAATATTSPANLTVTITYDSSAAAPTNAGSYAVVATINDSTYEGSASGTLVIAKAAPRITWSNPADILAGTALSGSQLNATSSVPGVFSYYPAAGTLLPMGAAQKLLATLTPTDANYAAATATVEINVLNTGPAIASPPTATPNPAAVGEAVSFSVVASDADQDALSYAWQFGDGTTGSGATATHTYTAVGTFSVAVTVSDAAGVATSSSMSLKVSISSAGGGAQPPVAGTDSDSDGFPDTVEQAAGTSPNNASDTPTGQPATSSVALPDAKMKIKLGFGKPGNDSITLAGTLVLPGKAQLGGQKLTLGIGDVAKSFTLDPKGGAKSGGDAVKITSKPSANPSTAKLSVKLTKGTFASALANYGLTNTTIKSKKVDVPIFVIFNETFCQQLQHQLYSATTDKTGGTSDTK